MIISLDLLMPSFSSISSKSMAGERYIRYGK